MFSSPSLHSLPYIFFSSLNQREESRNQESITNPFCTMFLNLNKKTVIFRSSKRWKELDWCRLLILLPPLSLLLFISISSMIINNSPFTNFTPIKSFLSNPVTHFPFFPYQEVVDAKTQKRLDELNRSRIAVCLVGGARRFELTGPSIIRNILNVYPNADLFLHAPFDGDSFKFSFLKVVKRKIAGVKIFKPVHMNETESEVRVLTPSNSPNGIQGLLQYFNLVEGCLTMIKQYQSQNNFTYDWVVRTRVDGYWNAPLDPFNFVKGKYLIPPGSNYQGLNDRLGIGDLNTSTVALSRLSLIPKLDSANLTQLNSESAFKAQLTTQGVQYFTHRIPFCIVSHRKYTYPPNEYGVPVASMGSKGPLSGTKCRPCKPVCKGPCVGDVMKSLHEWWSWTNWENGTSELCDAHLGWEKNWGRIYDKLAGKKGSFVRKRMNRLTLRECVKDFEELKRKSFNWESPPFEEICGLRLGSGSK